MSRVEITSVSTPINDGVLQTDNPLDGNLQVVKDQDGNSSTLLLATDETQVNSTLRVHTDSSELLDLEDNGSNNRFNINRDVQKINLDFASKPTDINTQVGAIRTAIDGTNLADVVKFQENGQVTFTERVKLESDSTVTTQTSSVIQATTTNANLVLSPNGTGGIIASVPDGTATGGNARGQYAVDLQTNPRSNADQVASGNRSFIGSGNGNKASGISSVVVGGSLNSAQTNQSFIGGGNSNNISGGTENAIVGGALNTLSSSYGFIGAGLSNTASSNYSTVSGGQSNTASTNTHATVVGGLSNTSSGQYSVSGGYGNTSSGARSVTFGAFNQATNTFSVALAYQSLSYLYSQQALGSGQISSTGDAQQSLLTARKSDTLTTAATTVLSLDGTGTTNLIIPNGNNRAWNVTSSWVAVVTAISGTATGISVGDVVTSVDLLGFKRVGGTSSASAHTSAATKTMVTNPAQYAGCSIAYTAGASQEMAMTFTGPTFVGGGSVTMRVVARIELSEVAW